MQNKNYKNGFTLVELLVALTVTSIILAAVATLAYALGNVNDSTNDTSQKQAQVRYATLRISELLKNGKLICGTADNDVAIWRADDNSDAKINPGELVYLEAGSSRNYLKLLEFPSVTSPIPVALSNILNGTAKASLISSYDERRIAMIPVCSNVQFVATPAPPYTKLPYTKFVTVSFNLVEDGTTHRYEITGALRGWAGNLLSADGSSIVSIVSDDD